MLGALAEAEAELAAEHAALGLDARDETALHPLLADGIAREGWGIRREVPYPNDAGEPEPGTPARKGDGARDRCDLVLLEDPDAELLDPVHASRRVRAAGGTLFADLAPEIESAATAGAVPPADAVWIEIKAVAQHAYRDGVPGPNRAYQSEMLNGPAADICKLMGDGVIERAAAGLVLFTETEDIARHDLDHLAHRLLDDGLPIGLPEVRSAPIADRAGNACVTVALFPLRGLGIGPLDDAAPD